LSLLDNPALDQLVSAEIRFEDAPKELPKLLAAENPALAPVIKY
jgi:hypothetical protein